MRPLSPRGATARCKCSMRARLQNRFGGASRPRRRLSVQRPPPCFSSAHGKLHFVRGEVSFIPNADGFVARRTSPRARPGCPTVTARRYGRRRIAASRRLLPGPWR